MNKIVIASCLVGALTMPLAAQARDVKITTTMNNYRGEGAYAAIYLTNSNNEYQQTFWVAGKRKKYYRDLKAWARGSKLNNNEYDGMTGASLHATKTLNITVSIPNEYFNAGYQLRIDTAVEHGYSVAPELSIPLTTSNNGKSFAGKTYVKALQFNY